MIINDNYEAQEKQHKFFSNPIHGTAERPRLCVAFDNRYIYVQIIDDDNDVTFTSAKFDINKLRTQLDLFAGAKLVGAAIAKTAKAEGISEVVFDNRAQFGKGGMFSRLLAVVVRQAGLKF